MALVTMQEVRSFFIRTLRDGTRRVHERKVMKSLISARKEEVERRGGVVKGGFLPFVAVGILMLGGWSAYFWGLATNNNK